MINWEDFILTHDKAKKLEIDKKEPSEESYIWFHCLMCFGGLCNKEEIEQITKIVYQAYLREKNKNE